jgi:hypothetical protein
MSVDFEREKTTLVVFRREHADWKNLYNPKYNAIRLRKFYVKITTTKRRHREILEVQA